MAGNRTRRCGRGTCLLDRMRGCLRGGRRRGSGIRPLSRTCRRGRVRVCKVTGDRRLCARMAEMGVIPGHEIEILCPASGERCLVRVNGGTLSLDGAASEHILVTETG